jgi:glutathione peroxidase
MRFKTKAILVAAVAILGTVANAEPPAPKNALDFRVKDIDGKDVDLGIYRGKAVLVVNTASRCGHTPQYADLQALWTRYKDSGFVLLGFPSNDFMHQEPGSDSAIKEFCTSKYHVTFPMFDKVDVKGRDQIPLYAYLTAQDTKPTGKGDISWNFEKFLIGRDGKVAARFSPGTSPSDSSVVRAIEAALARNP